MRPSYMPIDADHIPLAASGSRVTGGTRWIDAGTWFDKGIPTWLARQADVCLVAGPERGMDAPTFAKLWRRKVREMLAGGARCVQVRLCEGDK